MVYRTGDYGRFRQSLIAGLTTARRPRLSDLGTRANDDFTIALLDAWAVALDVLTFYQERAANESFLETATERLSLLELSRLIGYRLRPGVAASTSVAFTLEQGPGTPATITLQPGIKIQSVPGPGQSPQTFETTEQIEARLAWNAIQAQQGRPATIDAGTTRLYVQGTTTQLKVGDAILIVGAERLGDPANKLRSFRILTGVTTDADHDRTEISWLEALGAGAPLVAPRLYALRQRAALFGHNAPKPSLLNIDDDSPLLEPFEPLVIHLPGFDWKQWKGFASSSSHIDLDATYPGIVPGSWLVLSTASNTEIYRAKSVSTLSRSDFAISAKVTRVVPDLSVDTNAFGLQETAVFAQSEELEIADTPIIAPVFGSVLPLEQLESDLPLARPLAASGPRQHLRVTPTGKGLKIDPTGPTPTPVAPGEVLEVLRPPVWGGTAKEPTVNETEQWLAGASAATVEWTVRTEVGFEGPLSTAPGQVVLAAPPKEAEIVYERLEVVATVDGIATVDGRTVVTLTDPMRTCFDRGAVRFNANIAAATHGERVSEIMGQGDASRPFQRFDLKQPPLTYVGADNPEGFTSTLEVRVNDLLWTETPSFFGVSSKDRVYVTSQSDKQVTTVRFGDGKKGARLPTGTNNVRASYRKGIGLNGLLDTGQLSQLMSRPLGVKGAVNPEPATGAADPELLPEARTKAPLSVKTMGRAVSVQDYEDFARAFIGIDKATARWLWDGRTRRILVTVAGIDGAEIPEDGDLYHRLIDALAAAGDPFVQFTVKPYRNVAFAIEASIKIDTPVFLPDIVMAQVRAMLELRFAFAARNLGQPVSLSSIYAAIHEVPGVLGVDIDELYRVDTGPGGAGKPPVKLTAQPGQLASSGELLGAELLTIDLGASKLEVMA